MRRHAIALKAGFDPDQPRDELGQWTETGQTEEGQGTAGADATTDFSGIERPRPGRLGAVGIAVEVAQRLIETFRSENGFRDLFGYSESRAVALTTLDGEPIFGSSGRSPTFTDADGREAERVRAILIAKYPDEMNTSNIGQFQNDALFHAESNVLMRAAKKNGGSLTGRNLEVHVDRALCRRCETVLPLLSRELGHPTVRFFDTSGRVLILRNGSWVR
jgi:hypothetical protein